MDIKLLEQFLEVLQQFQMAPPSFSTGDYIAIGVAVISAVATVYVGFSTNRANKRINAANIDANITANARIEWIQNVRHATAELITAYWRVISSKPNEVEQNELFAHEKTALLVLYFGPDYNATAQETTDLYDKETNEGKNDLIVAFIEKLHSDLRVYHIKQLERERCLKTYSECMSCQNSEDEEGRRIKLNCEKDEYGTRFTPQECNEIINNAKKGMDEIDQFNRQLFSGISALSEIIRIYGKIEWNRAKGGK